VRIRGALIALLRVALISAVTCACILSMIWSYCTILVVTGPGLFTFLPALVFGFIATFVSTIVLNLKARAMSLE